jgi:signal transduction histidine kinase
METDSLQVENRALNEQIKLLARTERRLDIARRTISAQLRQSEALNTLVLRAGQARDPEAILGLTVETLLELFGMHQGVALLRPIGGGDGGELVITDLRTAEGIRSPSAALSDEESRIRVPELPRLSCIVGSLGSPWDDGEPRAVLDRIGGWFDGEGDETSTPVRAPMEVVIPLERKNKEPLGLIVLRRIDLIISFHERLMDSGDLPFLEIVRRHIEAALENVFLYRELSAFTVELERRVSDRTRDLARTNEELDQSLRRVRETQEQLLQAGRVAAVMTLIAGLSHELNNPVGVILGYAQQILADTSENAPLYRPLRAIERQAERAGTLVRTLAEFAQRRPAERKSVPVASLLASVAARAREEYAIREGIRIDVEPVAPDVPPLFVCIQDMESALLNVVQNALEATVDGAPVVLRAHWDATLSVVVVEVLDRGRGIPESILPRIFDPFFSTKPEGSGMGLGLSLARQIVESHRGRIEVESKVRAGTIARLSMPIGGPS